MNLITKRYASINNIPANDWDGLNTDLNPFLQHRFLKALEDSGAVSALTGWDIQHIVWTDSNDRIQAVMPQYFKTHSYGEYMFDWNWAQGITRAGIQYYPKAISAIPFTPVTGQRLMVSDQINNRSHLIKQVVASLEDFELSNFQCLYLTENEADDWKSAGAMIRQGYQFSWYNDQYADFDDFLARLRSSPRKKIRRERKSLIKNDIAINTFTAENITEPVWQFLIECYQQTYLKRSGHEGYLSPKFFHLMKSAMIDNIVVIQASKNNLPIASAFFIKGNDILYGRYWGTMEDIDGLHFECCYYQAIDYCIKNNIACLQPGTQGDYKRRRGFIPEHVYGAYFFTREDLQQPIQRYLTEESVSLEEQFDDWEKSTPYK